MRADRDVQRRFRRRVQACPDDLADALGRLAGVRERALGVGERLDRTLGQRDARAHGAAQAGREQLRGARFGVRLPWLARSA